MFLVSVPMKSLPDDSATVSARNIESSLLEPIDDHVPETPGMAYLLIRIIFQSS